MIGADDAFLVIDDACLGMPVSADTILQIARHDPLRNARYRVS